MSNTADHVKMMNYKKTLAVVGVFAVAMGFLEAIVVVYLRQLYYPQGFDFPLKMLSPSMVSVEWIREFATIVMLAAVGIIAGRNNLQRLLYFLYTFAVWDIFYYVALYLFLDWPSSLLTWDILFLIPVPWIGPVAAPVICSMTMIFMASALIPPIEKGKKVLIKPYQWVLIYSGALIILYTFLRDYLQMIFRSGLLTDSGNTDMKERLWSLMNSYTPGRYNWAMFFSGELLILIAIALVIRQINKKRP